MTTSTDAPTQAAAPQKKPRIAYAIATAFGTGYLRPAPGTWGSLVGILLSCALFKIWQPIGYVWYAPQASYYSDLSFMAVALLACFVIAGVGVWAANRVARHTNSHDPQFVVIDEVSGQMITLFLGMATTVTSPNGHALWTALFLGFILFRVFDIWKPFPIRRLENLPGGWGIMADDWMAGVYAAILLRLALHFNLV